MTINAQQLIGLQRAEFAKASRLQILASLVPLFITAFSGVAVFITESLFSYVAALCAFCLAALWTFLDWRFQRCRSQAERARRVTLLMEGLGEQISDSELKNLQSNFTAKPEDGSKYEDPDYYVTRAEPGDQRLAEMLEEAAFWSCHLMRASAQVSWLIFAGSIFFGVIFFFVAIPFFEASQVQGAVRVFCALLALLVSAEVLGGAQSYSVASNELRTIVSRLEAVRASGFPRADLLLVLCDYNSAVEGAPMILPGIYKANHSKLNRVWGKTRTGPPSESSAASEGVN